MSVRAPRVRKATTAAFTGGVPPSLEDRSKLGSVPGDQPKPISKRHIPLSDVGTTKGLIPRSLRIRDVAAIGAIYDHAMGLDIHDRHWLERAFEFFISSKLMSPRDVRVTPWNLLDGHDILAAGPSPPRMDAWVLCWVWNPRGPAALNADPDLNKQSSPRHFEDCVWGRTARETGAKIIVTYSTRFGTRGQRIGSSDHKTEIDARAFVGHGYIAGPVSQIRTQIGSRITEVLMETAFCRDFAETLCDSIHCALDLRDVLSGNSKK
ncbi:MAG: hypothetical protein WA884_10105 [Methyloceanibacter sp.]